MQFIKNFFDDDSKIIGLCGFGITRLKHRATEPQNDFFFNPFETDKHFETNFSKNILLL